MKQPLGQWACKQREHVVPTRTLTKNCDVIRVTTKGADIALHPSEGSNDVQRTEVSNCAGTAPHGGVCEPSEWPQSIIDRNHDHVLLSNKARKVIGVLMPSGISTPMDPNHDRYGLSTGCGCRDIEVKTVFGTDR